MPKPNYNSPGFPWEIVFVIMAIALAIIVSNEKLKREKQLHDDVTALRQQVEMLSTNKSK